MGGGRGGKVDRGRWKVKRGGRWNEGEIGGREDGRKGWGRIIVRNVGNSRIRLYSI